MTEELRAKEMDKKLIRIKARAKYKELMKGVSKKKRPPFRQVFPMIKAMLVHNVAHDPVKKEAEELGVSDMDLLNAMLSVADEENNNDVETLPAE